LASVTVAQPAAKNRAIAVKDNFEISVLFVSMMFSMLVSFNKIYICPQEQEYWVSVVLQNKL
jgi:hypothetical protein